MPADPYDLRIRLLQKLLKRHNDNNHHHTPLSRSQRQLIPFLRSRGWISGHNPYLVTQLGVDEIEAHTRRRPENGRRKFRPKKKR